MHEIYKVAPLVREALERYPQARNSDTYLYYILCRDILSENGLDIEKVSLSDGLLYRGSYSLPNYETVRRTRQKLQENCPWLASVPEVEAIRIKNEKQVREFVRG